MLSKKEKILIGTLIGFVFILFLSIIGLIYSMHSTKVVNNYNIEHVDTVVIQEKEEPIISDKPFTNEKTSDVIVYSGYKCQDVSYTDMGYTTPVYKFIPIKINGWCLEEKYQKILYEKCKKYNINYIKALAIAYKEGSRNNPYAIHTNSNGSTDIGLMQFNSNNTDILKKVTKSTDVEWLKVPEINIECAVYLMWRNENYYEHVDSLYDSLVIYNGGYDCVLKIKSGKYTLNCPASKYAATVISYMNELYKYYLESEI